MLTPRLLPAVVVGALLVAGTAAASGRSAAAPGVPPHRPDAVPATGAAVRYVAPVPEPLRVLTPFDPPATPYGPGHLGVDLAAAQGEAIRSAGPGTVGFAGQVAGRGVVVVAHPDGISTEYEPITPLVRAGVQVVAGTVLGQLHGRHGSCAPSSCLHWGARRGGRYLDPLGLLSPLGTVRLLPWAR